MTRFSYRSALVGLAATTGLLAACSSPGAPAPAPVDATPVMQYRHVIECADSGMSFDATSTDPVCIRALQNYLATIGAANNGVTTIPAETGVYDADTASAVQEYENDWNATLAATGSDRPPLNADPAAGNDTLATMAVM